jgi:2-amino-4-hydroxy-6-hydroxymethyldihydropteridine diphosphokinase
MTVTDAAAARGAAMSRSPILIGLGGNLPSPRFGAPVTTLNAAVARLRELDIRVLARSRWYESAPVPVSDQPNFINGVVSVATELEPAALLALLHRVEAEFGRTRGLRNAARILDLDLLAYRDIVNHDGVPQLPHPAMHLRGFVLLPLREIAPRWVHPWLGKSLDALIAELPPGQDARPRG